ncbi:MAG: hypothetical protein ACXVEF_29785 [Polyangiales bacterium]
MRWHLVVLVVLGSIVWSGCGTDTVQEVDFDAAAEVADEDAVVTGDGGDDATSDSSADETSDGSLSDGAGDTTVADSGKPDSTPSDVAPGDSSSTMFACGTETCSSKFQFCHKDTSPGTCPAPDSGLCPAGCPGCAALGLHCQALPSKCFAAPSCMCLVGEVCGFSGSCDEMGGFTVGCKGI